MTGWDFLENTLEWFSNRVTRILGIAQGTVALLCGTTGLIPDSQIKYWLAASAVLTFWRGQSTGKTYAQAKAVLAANPTQPSGAKSESRPQ